MKPGASVRFSGYFFVLEHQKVFKFTFTLSISDSTCKSLPRESKAQKEIGKLLHIEKQITSQ